jgi:hypothetical protein
MSDANRTALLAHLLLGHLDSNNRKTIWGITETLLAAVRRAAASLYLHRIACLHPACLPCAC